MAAETNAAIWSNAGSVLRAAGPAPVADLVVVAHAAAQAEHQDQRRDRLDVVVQQRAAAFKLLARVDQALVLWRDAPLVLDDRLDVVA